MSEKVPLPEDLFSSGVAVVTGAGAGIGAGLAMQLGALGMHVYVVDVDGERAKTTVDAIVTAGGEASGAAVDVASADEMDGLAERVRSERGAVRLLVNNAGIETIGLSWEVPSDRWAATLDINVRGVVNGVRAFLPEMIRLGEPAWIANLSSVGAFGHMPLQTAYIVTKHAVQAFTECLALELEIVGAPIRVSSVIPGMVRTRIFDESADDGGGLAAAHRATMRDAMAGNGMDLAPACRRIVEGIARGDFWVSTQPRMTRQFLDRRIAFLRDQAQPAMAEELAPLFRQGEAVPL